MVNFSDIGTVPVSVKPLKVRKKKTGITKERPFVFKFFWILLRKI